MKFSIEGFCQKKLFCLGLDHKDALILRFIKDFIASGKLDFKIINGEIYYWICYQYILDEIPIIDIKTTDHLYERIKKYLSKQLFKKILVYNKNGRYGRYVYLTPCEALHQLDYTNPSKNRMANPSKNRMANPSKNRIKDPSINDPSFIYSGRTPSPVVNRQEKA